MASVILAGGGERLVQAYGVMRNANFVTLATVPLVFVTVKANVRNARPTTTAFA